MGFTAPTAPRPTPMAAMQQSPQQMGGIMQAKPFAPPPVAPVRGMVQPRPVAAPTASGGYDPFAGLGGFGAPAPIAAPVAAPVMGSVRPPAPPPTQGKKDPFADLLNSDLL